MGWRSVSCFWRLWWPTSFGLLCQFECRPYQSHRRMFLHFRPLVTLSTASWFGCRSRCRPDSSWCRVSRLPLELRTSSITSNSKPVKLPSPLVRLFQLVTKASHHLCTTKAPHFWLCTLTKLLANLENCQLPALLERKRMSVTVYSPVYYFIIIHTTKGFDTKSIICHKCPSTFLSIIFSYFFFNAFLPKITLCPCQGFGVGVEGVHSWTWWQGQKWRTVGQKVTYSGPKSDVRRAEKWRTGQNTKLECYTLW